MSVLQQPLGPSEVTRLKEIIDDGIQTLSEIETLKAGISDTIKAVAEELQIPAKLLKKVINSAHKGNYAELESELSDVETLLQAAGKK